MSPASRLLQREIIRLLKAILGACRGMLTAWEQYLEAEDRAT